MVTYVYKCENCQGAFKFSICCKRECPNCGEKTLEEVKQIND